MELLDSRSSVRSCGNGGWIGLPQVKDANHVLVGDLSRQDQLMLEALDNVRLGRQLGANNFQRDYFVNLAVQRFVDSSHPALPEHL